MLLFSLLAPLGQLQLAAAADTAGLAPNALFVSPTGSDSNPGTEAQPFATLAKARDVVRTMNAAMTGDITVYLRGGEYSLSQTVKFNELDSGMNGHKVIYQAYPGEQPVLSGGVKVTGTWAAVSGKPYLKVNVPQVPVTRQFFVDGERRQRAHTELPIGGKGWVNDPATSQTRDGFLVDGDQLGVLAKPQYAEVHQQNTWRDYVLAVKGQSTNVNGDRELFMVEPAFEEALLNSPLTQAAGYTLPFQVENDLTLLDQPGEWYFDRDTKELYYYPLPGENVSAINGYLPTLNTLIDIQGSDFNHRARNIRFEGITFKDTTFNEVNGQGLFGNQAEWLFRPDIPGAGNSPWREHPVGAVQINAAEYIEFVGNRFVNLGAVGLEIVYANHNKVIGNIFYDISEAAVVIGTHSGAVIDQPYESVPQFNKVYNNVVRYTGQEFYGAPAIMSFFAQDTDISHNDIAEVPYCGININTWTPDDGKNPTRRNIISYNKVENAMMINRDCGSIYTWATLGDADPANYTKIHHNYLISRYQDYGVLYLDETSKYANVTDNVVEAYESSYMNMYDTSMKKNWLYLWRDTIKYVNVTRNYSNTEQWVNRATLSSVDPAILYDPQNPPSEVVAIKEQAGLEPAYKGLLNQVPTRGANQAPQVSLGSDVTTSVMGTVKLTALVTDDGLPRGSLKKLKWEKAEGPGSVTLGSPLSYKTTAAFSAPGAYKIKFTVNDGDAETVAYLNVTVTEEANPYTNYALNKPASASAYWNDNGLNQYPPERANDGDVNTGWAGRYRDGASDEWWQVDLKTEVNLKRVEFVARHEACCSSWLEQNKYWSLLASNDPTFSDYTKVKFFGTIGGIPIEEKGTGVFNVADTGKYRYIRLLKSPFGQSFIAELRVFGQKLTAPNDANLDDLTVSEGALTPAFSKDVTNYTVLLPNEKDRISITPYLANSLATLTINGGPAADSVINGPIALQQGDNPLAIEVKSEDQTTTKTYTVTVIRSTNGTPQVSAGPDQTVNLLQNASLQGTINDPTVPAGKSLSYAWSKVKGPGTVTFTDPRAANPKAAFSAPGDYEIKLVGSDGEFSAEDTVVVRVTAAELSPNLAQGKTATASSWFDQSSGSTLYAPAKAVDGNIDTIWLGDWNSPPKRLTVDLAQAYKLKRVEIVTSQRSFDEHIGFRHNFKVLASNDPNFAEGSYEVLGVQGVEDIGYKGTWVANLDTAAYRYIRVVKQDLPGEWGFVVAELRVYGADALDGPIVTAGDDVTVSILSNAELKGAKILPAGKTDLNLTYLWSLVSGPANVTFGHAAEAETTAAFSAPGDYTLKLTGTNGGYSVSDTVNIHVESAVMPENIALNKPAVASDWFDDQTPNRAMYAPDKAVDGNINTMWIGYWTKSPHTLTVDLQDRYDISRIEAVMSQSQSHESYGTFRRNFKVLASNDPSFAEGSYVTLGSQDMISLPVKATWVANVDAKGYRYVRILKPDEWGFIVSELRVYAQKKSEAKDITGFEVAGQVGSSIIDSAAHTVEFHVPYGTDITALTPTVTVSDKATVSPASGSPVDFSQPVTYTVTAENGTAQAWTVTAVIDPLPAPEAPVVTLSDIKASSVSLEWASAERATGYEVFMKRIDEDTFVQVHSDILTTGTGLKVVVSDLVSNTSYDFKVTAIGETELRTDSAPVSAKTLPSSEKAILSFLVDGQVNETVIDPNNYTVLLHVPFGTDTTTLKPVLTVSPYAVVSPASEAIVNLTAPKIFTVTAQDSSTQEWTVTVIVDPDTVAPTAPGNLAASNVTKTSLTLTWQPSMDNDQVASYIVYKDGVESKRVQGSQLSVDFGELQKYTTYTFVVRAVDRSGNVSGQSLELKVTTAHDNGKGNDARGK